MKRKQGDYTVDGGTSDPGVPSKTLCTSGPQSSVEKFRDDSLELEWRGLGVEGVDISPRLSESVSHLVRVRRSTRPKK